MPSAWPGAISGTNGLYKTLGARGTQQEALGKCQVRLSVPPEHSPSLGGGEDSAQEDTRQEKRGCGTAWRILAKGQKAGSHSSSVAPSKSLWLWDSVFCK